MTEKIDLKNLINTDNTEKYRAPLEAAGGGFIRALVKDSLTTVLFLELTPIHSNTIGIKHGT